MEDRQHAGVIERNAEVKDVTVGIENIRARINRFRAFEGHKLAYLDVKPAGGVWNRDMKYHPGFHDVGLHDLVLAVIEETDGVDVASVAPIKELCFKSPIKAVPRSGKGTLGREHHLIQERLVRAIGKEVS